MGYSEKPSLKPFIVLDFLTASLFCDQFHLFLAWIVLSVALFVISFASAFWFVRHVFSGKVIVRRYVRRSETIYQDYLFTRIDGFESFVSRCHVVMFLNEIWSSRNLIRLSISRVLLDLATTFLPLFVYLPLAPWVTGKSRDRPSRTLASLQTDPYLVTPFHLLFAIEDYQSIWTCMPFFKSLWLQTCHYPTICPKEEIARMQIRKERNRKESNIELGRYLKRSAES
jgi:hypothetical protein